MTVNFKKYKEFITMCGGLPDTNEKGNLDKYYVIELVRRGKDNPDMPASNYHFKNYYIYSWHDYEKYEQEIKDICTLLKLRAYGSVNYKLMSQVALDTLAESARRVAAHDYKKFYTIFESASGKFVERGNNLWVVDIDGKTTGFELNAMCAYINTMESEYARNIVYTMPTKSGVHLICHPFNLKQFHQNFNKENPYIAHWTGDIPNIKKNCLTLLFENLN